MSRNIKIQINNSSIRLQLNEFWYFFYYLKSISDFYDKSENKNKKIMITFPGTSIHFTADKNQFKNIQSQVFSYTDSCMDEYNHFYINKEAN